METRVSVTPHQAVDWIGRLVAESRHQEAFDYWKRVEPELTDKLTADELYGVCQALETAAMAMSLEEQFGEKT
jgi:hypothetical protein